MAEKEKDNDEKRPGLGKDGADVKEFGQMMLELVPVAFRSSENVGARSGCIFGAESHCSPNP